MDKREKDIRETMEWVRLLAEIANELADGSKLIVRDEKGNEREIQLPQIKIKDQS